MAKFKSTKTKSVHTFSFTQRDIDLLVSILVDLTTGASIRTGGANYVPRSNTMEDLYDILKALDKVGMSVKNDYLTNFKEVQ
jgi:hypothetical protein